MMKSRLLILFALILFGCATADFHQYTGTQQNWPTASGTFVSTKYGVPAYYGPPNRPYTVLGSLDATTCARSWPRRGECSSRRCPCSQKNGADAIIVMGSGKERVGTSSFGNEHINSNYSGGYYGDIIGNSFYGRTYGNSSSTTNMFGSSFGSYQGKASVLVIKFKGEG
jgi:hypothetical protein